jgi:hypothetical protein
MSNAHRLLYSSVQKCHPSEEWISGIGRKTDELGSRSANAKLRETQARLNYQN